MTKATKALVERVIEELVDRTLDSGCIVQSADGVEGYICGESPKGLGFYVKWENCHSPQIYQIPDSNQIMGHHIMLGDALERIVNLPNNARYASEILRNIEEKNLLMIKLICLWGACFTEEDLEDKTGLTKSLQQIVKGSGWEEIEHYQGETEPLIESRLKSKPASDLILFLAEVLNISPEKA